MIDEARVEDWPDAPMRGVYAVGSWYDAAPPGNASFLNATLDAMARAKHSFIMFNANGAELRVRGAALDAAIAPKTPALEPRRLVAGAHVDAARQNSVRSGDGQALRRSALLHQLHQHTR